MDAAASDGDGALTVGAYLVDWLPLQRLHIQPSTWHSYEGAVRRYLLPTIGDVPMQDLTVPLLNRTYAQLVQEGGRDGEPLSPNTVGYAARILHKALADGVRTGELDRNVATDASVPRVDEQGRTASDRELQVWDAREARAFLDATADDRFRDIWIVALGTGMRRGEILGLRWKDVDLEDAQLHCRRSLAVVDRELRMKPTKSSIARSLGIDHHVVAVLEQRRNVQAQQREAVGAAWDNGWDLVFTDDVGSPIHPDVVTVHFRTLVRRLDVPVIRMHDLRHTHATLLLQAGVPVNVVSQRLGHSTARITLDVYAHVLPAMDLEAADRFAAHVYGDVDGGLVS